MKRHATLADFVRSLARKRLEFDRRYVAQRCIVDMAGVTLPARCWLQPKKEKQMKVKVTLVDAKGLLVGVVRVPGETGFYCDGGAGPVPQVVVWRGRAFHKRDGDPQADRVFREVKVHHAAHRLVSR